MIYDVRMLKGTCFVDYIMASIFGLIAEEKFINTLAYKILQINLHMYRNVFYLLHE